MLLVIGLPAHCALALNYTLFDPPGGTDTAVYGFSGGVAVGSYLDSSLNTHAFSYDGSSFAILDPSDYSGYGVGLGVSGGSVVGVYSGPAAVLGFVHNGSGYTTLAPLGGNTAAVTNISVGGGMVAGTYNDASFNTHGFEYNGSFTTLDDPLAFNDTEIKAASGTNVAGFYVDSLAVNHGLFFDGTHYTTLDPAGATYSQALAVSGNEVAGVYQTSPGGDLLGFLWNSTSGFSGLQVPGAFLTQPLSISGNKVAGIYDTFAGQFGFIYDGTNFTTISPPNSTNVESLYIDGNTVAGFYSDVAENTHGFEATLDGASLPLPTPAALALVGMVATAVVCTYTKRSGGIA